MLFCSACIPLPTSATNIPPLVASYVLKKIKLCYDNNQKDLPAIVEALTLVCTYPLDEGRQFQLQTEPSAQYRD
jgi:hypothetical protein